MKMIQFLTVTFLSALFLVSFSTQAGSDLDSRKEAFTQSAYEQSVSENQLILIDVFADWCSTCAAQQRVLASYFKQFPESELIIFEVDFDTQKDWVRHFEAPRQSTLVLFRGEQRLWFSVAQTNQSVIFEELKLHDGGAD